MWRQRIDGLAVLIAPAGAVVMAATVAWGLIALATGHDLGTATPPFLYEWAPRLVPAALPMVVVAVVAVATAPRLRELGPVRFAVAVTLLALALRVAVQLGRGGGFGALWSVFDVPRPEAANEYLPALPALDFGARFFLDTFAEVGPSLTVNAIGHPPGLLLVIHWLGIERAPALALLCIDVGVLVVPLTYALGRRLLGETPARTAAVLCAFSPSAVIGGATSADALFATLGTLALLALVARPAVARSAGAAALALASFFSWANLGVGALAVIVVQRRDGLRAAIVLAAVCGAVLLAFYGVLFWATGFDPIGAIRAAEGVYREGVAAHRPYAFWLFGAPTAFLLAAGLPLAWLGLRALAAGERVALALFAVLAISALLGFTKSETERIYLFLVPPLCLAAASALPPDRVRPVLAALAAQAVATELLFYTVW